MPTLALTGRPAAQEGRIARRARPPRVLPGFGLTLGVSLVYLSLVVLIPLSATFLKAAQPGFDAFWATITAPRVLAAYRVSFGTALVAAGINVVVGVLVAWVLARYEFPGRRVLDALVDLPFALPTAVAGISLTTIYAPHGVLGAPLATLGVQIAFTSAGIVLALVFIGLPFVVRSIQPVLESIDPGFEEAAASLGATRLQTFLRVILPSLVPALTTGFAMAFARGLGEYGSVIFIAGNMPMKTEIAPLLIITKLEQYDYAGATAIAVAMLVISFALLLAINLAQAWHARRWRAS
jgi:sulfate transport system permease protein